MARLTVRGLDLLLVSAHAPHAEAPEVQRRAWWAEFRRVLAVVARIGIPCIVGIDANATLNGGIPGRCGSVGAETPNSNTEPFEAALEELQLAAPATLLRPERGGTRTWRCSRGVGWIISTTAVLLQL